MSEANLKEPHGGTTRNEALALFRENLDLADGIAHVIARKRCGRHIDFEDLVGRLVSFAREGLFDAACRFDAAKGIPFRGYAVFRVRGAVFDGMRAESALPRRAHERLGRAAARAEHVAAYISAEANGMVGQLLEDEDGLTLLLAEGNAESALAGAAAAQLVHESIASLPPRESELIRRHYLEGERFDHVAAELGLSKSWASRLHTRGLATLRKRCAQVSL